MLRLGPTTQTGTNHPGMRYRRWHDRLYSDSRTRATTHGANLKSEETDISRVVEQELQSSFGLHRVAVGEHLMLGGDNLDIALAKFAEQLFCESSVNPN